MSTSKARATAIVIGLFATGLLAGALTGSAAASRATDPYAGLDVFARVLTLVEDKYVDEVPHDTLMNAAVNGIMDELDAHSRWMDSDEYRAFRADTKGNYEGIGVEVRRIPEGVLVARVLPGGPAERDGLLANDKIVAIDDISIAGSSLDEVATLLKGPRGDSVSVRIVREGWDSPRDIKTVRDQIHTPSVTAERIDNIAYLRLIQFQDNCGADLEREFNKLAALQGAPITGIVLDLRDNPGGLLDQAVAVMDLFIDEGVIVSTKSRVEGETSFSATRGSISTDIPIAVLVNGMSASASEIVAGAMQDSKRGTLIGTQTYGKGTVQSLFENPDATAIKLTVGRYYTPSGEPVAANEGREPDQHIAFPAKESTHDQLLIGIAALDIPDAEIERLTALANTLKRPKSKEIGIPWDTAAIDRGDTDPQLAHALRFLTEASELSAPSPG